MVVAVLIGDRFLKHSSEGVGDFVRLSIRLNGRLIPKQLISLALDESMKPNSVPG